MIRTIFAIGIWALALGTVDTAVAATEIRITINGIRSDSGSVRVAVYRSADGFATKEGLYRSFVTAARQGSVEVVFEDLPPGFYGLATFHDENDNDEFDKTVLGLPAEGFGFGNDAPVRLATPNFQDAAVKVEAGVVRETVTMRYW